MNHAMKKRSEKVGLSPGTLIHIGRAYGEPTKIRLMRYGGAFITEKEVRTLEELRSEKNQPGICWVDIIGLQDVSLLEQIGILFGLHPLMMEDILNTDQRPKTEDFADYIFIVLKNISNSGDQGLLAEQISIVLGRNFVLSFQERESELFDPIRERLRTAKGRIRHAGADYLAHHVMDAVVDRYFGVLEAMEERIEMLEDDLMSHTTPAKLQAIHQLKRDLIMLRKSLWPLREAISLLRREDSPLIADSNLIYFKDISDHIFAVIDTVDTFRDMLAGLMDIYLSAVSMRMNQIMKVLTIIATIFMPLTFLSGVYGMNFEFIPGLHWRWSFWVFWLGILTITGGMLMLFRKRKWL